MNNTILLIVGKSGSGKTTIQNELEKRYGLTPIPSYTTRPMRKEGEGGHLFVTENYFSQLKDIVAYTRFNGYEYGATADQIEKLDTYVIDPTGVNFLKKLYKGNKTVKVIYIDVPLTERFKRMMRRGDGLRKTIDRLINDHYMFKNLQYDIAIKNENLVNAVDTVYGFLKRGN